jgi:hypothetical protein
MVETCVTVVGIDCVVIWMEVIVVASRSVSIAVKVVRAVIVREIVVRDMAVAVIVAGKLCQQIKLASLLTKHL